MRYTRMLALGFLLAGAACQNDEIAEEMSGEEQSDYGDITGADTTAPEAAPNIRGAPERETPLTENQPDTVAGRAPETGGAAGAARDTTGN